MLPTSQALAINSVLPDGLSLAMALLTLFVAAIVVLFSRRYMRADPRPWRYSLRIGMLVASVVAFLVTDNIVVFALAWMASGVLLAQLIGHAGGLADAPRARNRALTAFAIGDSLLIAGLALLGHHAGSLRIDAIVAEAPGLPPALALAVAVMLVVAAAARCALPPFSGWLLSSMTAPTPVSALMHAGLVNAGGFLLIRFAPVLEAAPAARLLAVGTGLAAALYGIGVMAVRPDVKRALAGSTVSQMGFMVLSCGLGAYGAALWHILAHGLFKAALFLGSGSAIGTPGGAPRSGISAGAATAIAGATLAVSIAVAFTGGSSGGFVPLALGSATALATLAAVFGDDLPAAGRVKLALALAGLVALHAAGLSLAHAAVGADGPALLAPAGLVVLLAGLLAAWVWQLRRREAGRAMPARLYVHLLNAGA